MFKYIEPEVSGGFGEKTELDNSVHPPVVKTLEYEFGGWLGNDIVETFPCYLVTQELKLAIEREKLSGIDFNDVIVTTNETFDELYPNTKLPKFYWMKTDGKAGEDDFGLGKDFRLVISSKVLGILDGFNVSECDFEDFL